MISLNLIPKKTPAGINYISNASLAERKRLGQKLRQLLILVDGYRTVAELIEKTLYPTELEAFEILQQEGFIDFEDTLTHEPTVASPAIPSVLPNSSPSTKSFSKVRFEALNILLDLSMQDFSIRPWIDKFETTTSIEELEQIVRELTLTPYAVRFGLEIQKLKSLFY